MFYSRHLYSFSATKHHCIECFTSFTESESKQRQNDRAEPLVRKIPENRRLCTVFSARRMRDPVLFQEAVSGGIVLLALQRCEPGRVGCVLSTFNRLTTFDKARRPNPTKLFYNAYFEDVSLPPTDTFASIESTDRLPRLIRRLAPFVLV